MLEKETAGDIDVKLGTPIDHGRTSRVVIVRSKGHGSTSIQVVVLTRA